MELILPSKNYKISYRFLRKGRQACKNPNEKIAFNVALFTVFFARTKSAKARERSIKTALFYLTRATAKKG